MTKSYSRIKNKKKLQEYLDGLLLGDGSISIDRRKGRLPSFNQTTRLSCIGWAQKIKNDINNFGLPCSIFGPYNRLEVTVRAETHPFFQKMRKRWYPNGKKKIPKDLALTPIILVNWYLGDGKLDKDDIITIFTEAFKFEEVKILSDLINKTVGIISYVKKNEEDRPVIRIRACDSSIFLSYISNEFRIPCFLYKFNIKSTHQKMKWLPPENEFLRKRYGKVPTRSIANKLRRSLDSVYHRANRLGLKGRRYN